MAGGFGYGKTVTVGKFTARTALYVQNTHIALVAASYKKSNELQYEHLLKMIPDEFIKLARTTPNENYIELTNGTKLETFSASSSESVEKYRGGEYLIQWFEEASTIKYSFFKESFGRARNKAGYLFSKTPRVETREYEDPITHQLMTKEYTINDPILDINKIICCTNPNFGWVYDLLVLKSESIYYNGMSDKNPESLKKQIKDCLVNIKAGMQKKHMREADFDIDKYANDIMASMTRTETFDNYDCHLGSGYSNPYVSSTFTEEGIQNTLQETLAFLGGFFTVKSGLVVDNYKKAIVNDQDFHNLIKTRKDDFEFFAGADFGTAAHTTLLLMARHKKTNVITHFDTYYETGAQVSTHAKGMKDMMLKYGLKPDDFDIYGDPAGVQTQANGHTYFSLYAGFDIYMCPGNNKNNIGVPKITTLIDNGMLRILNTEKYLVSELEKLDYADIKYGEKAQDKISNKADHAFTALKYGLTAVDELAEGKFKVNPYARGVDSVIEANNASLDKLWDDYSEDENEYATGTDINDFFGIKKFY